MDYMQSYNVSPIFLAGGSRFIWIHCFIRNVEDDSVNFENASFTTTSANHFLDLDVLHSHLSHVV